MDLTNFNTTFLSSQTSTWLACNTSFTLFSTINAVGDLAVQVCEKYPQPFSGLGSMTEEYVIHLNTDAKPITISTPRRITLPLLPKIKVN